MLRRQPGSKPKHFVFTLVFVFLMYLFIEGACYASLLLLDRFNRSYEPRISTLSEKRKIRLRNFLKNKKGEYTGQHPVLGWVTKMRDDREYEPFSPPNIVRISAFGDSYTFGSDVTLTEAWTKQLSALASSIEVLNYGVGGYGLDQAYLRYLEVGTAYNPHIVFIGYMSENIARNVNVFRGFYSARYPNIYTKPRFKVVDGELVLLENPLSTLEDYARFLKNDREVLVQLGMNDYHYQSNSSRGQFDFLPSVRFTKFITSKVRKRLIHPIFERNGMYVTTSEAYEVTVKIFDAFYRKVLENGALPVIIILPDLGDRRRSRSGMSRRYTPLLGDFQSKGYRFIDVLSAFEPYQSRYTVAELVETSGHFSALGNKLAAEYMFTQLEEWGFTNPSQLRDAVQAERSRFGLGVE